MFEKLKKKKNISLGLTKNSKKYNITHNGNLEELDNSRHDDAKLVYLLRPIITIEETQRYSEVSKKEEFVCEAGQMVKLASSVKRSYYSDNRLHEKLIPFQRLDDYDVSFYYPSIKDKNKYYHANEDALKRYAIACTKKLSITIDSLTESITLSYELLHKDFYSNNIEIWEVLCNLIDVFENFEPLIVNQFAPGIMDTLKNFIAIIDNDTSYMSKREMVQEVRLYIRDVHKTMMSFKADDDVFPTPFQLIEQKRIEVEEAKRIETEKKEMQRRINQEKQNDFLEKVRARRELLKDFNEPMENVPLKLAKKNEEMFSDFLKENA